DGQTKSNCGPSQSDDPLRRLATKTRRAFAASRPKSGSDTAAVAEGQGFSERGATARSWGPTAPAREEAPPAPPETSAVAIRNGFGGARRSPWRLPSRPESSRDRAAWWSRTAATARGALRPAEAAPPSHAGTAGGLT